MKKQYYLIDVFKLIFAIGIVLIHSEAISAVSTGTNFWILHGILRLGVPFFFVSSGFMIGSKINEDNSFENIKYVIECYIKRLLKLLIFWESLAIVLTGISRFLAGKSSIYIIVKTVQDIFFYPRNALWYIQASIVGAIIIYWFYSHKMQRILFPCAVFFYCWALVCNSYYFMVENSVLRNIVDIYMKIFVSARNGIFLAPLYLVLGIKCWDISCRIIASGGTAFKIRLFIMTLVIYCVFLIELFVVKDNAVLPLHDDGSLFIILPIFTFSFVLFCSLFYSTASCGLGTRNIRNLSTGIYLLHRPIMLIIEIVSTYVLHNEMNKFGIFLITTIVATCICVVTYKIKFKFAELIK